MSREVFFNNRSIVEPGVYAQVLSGETVRPTNFPFGVTVLIDTGTFKGWGGGSGINGELKNGINSHYSFRDYPAFKGFVKGGEQFMIADYLFNPLVGANGPSLVTVIRACTTTCATMDINFTNARLNIKAKNEGLVSNSLFDEIRAQTVIKLNSATLTIGNIVNLNITNQEEGDVVQNITFSTTSTSVIENSNLIIEAINNGTTGCYATLIAQSIVILAPLGVGSLGNFYTIDSSGTALLSPTYSTIGSQATFSGGVDGTRLLKGVAMKMRQGDRNPQKAIFDFYLGTFRGKNANGFYYGENDEIGSKPILMFSTPEMATFDQLIQFLRNSGEFGKSFELGAASQVTPNGQGGAIVSGDFQYDYFRFSGGTEVYNPTDLDAVLESLRETTNTYFISDRFGAEAISVQNEKILASITDDSDFERFLIIAGGKDSTRFETESDSSIEIAKHYDSSRVILVHSGAELKNRPNKRKEKWSALVSAYNVAGRLGGLEPQEPLTFKRLKLANFNHVLNIPERRRALQGGVLHIRDVEGMGIVVNQGINTLQANTELWNADGTSYEISIMNISSQLNKELILNLRPLFVGGNRGRITEADVKANVEAYLLSQSNETGVARLIVKSTNVVVVREADQFNISYAFEPNGPINKLFITGFMLDNIN